MKKLLTLTAAVLAVGGVALAEDAPKAPAAKEPAKPAAEKKADEKLAEVRFCPMMGNYVGGQGAGQRVYKNYKVYFC
jgi:hypothetical protein